MDETERARDRVIAFLDLMDSWPGKPGYADEIYSLNETPLSRSDIRAAIEQSAAHARVVAANAWDEGFDAGHYIGSEPRDCECKTNPYRITEENN